MIVGAIFGADALGKRGDVEKECTKDDPHVCTDKGFSAYEGLKTSGTISTIGFAAGGALVAAGVVLWVVAPSAPNGGAKKTIGTRVWVAPQVGQTSGITAGARW